MRPESLSSFPDKHCFCGHKSEAPREAGQILFDKTVFKIQIFLIIIYHEYISFAFYRQFRLCITKTPKVARIPRAPSAHYASQNVMGAVSEAD